MKEEWIKADVLCVGGGIAGLMAAIRAGELGAKVLIAEKGNILHSGRGGVGNDHFLCYIPSVHGPDIDEYIQAVFETQMAEGLKDMTRSRLHEYFQMTFDIVKLWDQWGINMKYHGKYEFAGHAFPGAPLTHLKYEGHMQKKALTGKALSLGVEILNRVMIFDLLIDEGLVGAVGIDTRNDRIIKFHAKSIVLGTGVITRLYPNTTPGWFSNRQHPATLTGDGRAMAYRAGVELMNMDKPNVHVGPKYFERSGQGTWIGVLRDADGRPVGPYVTKPERNYGDITVELNKNIFIDYAGSGEGPLYLDCGGMSDEDYEYMLHWFTHEGLNSLKNHFKEEGVDLREHPVEFATYYRGCSRGKICVNEDCLTSIKGLYATGDEVGGGISYAAVFGRLAGQYAAEYAMKTEHLENEPDKIRAYIAEKKNLFRAILERETGPDWKEVNIALNQIMLDYTGNVRSEALLKAGLSYLGRLKERTYSTIFARNQHELSRCLEVLNLIDLGELVFITADASKETRGNVRRIDYPVTNTKWNKKSLIVRKIGDNSVAEWR